MTPSLTCSGVRDAPDALAITGPPDRRKLELVPISMTLIRSPLPRLIPAAAVLLLAASCGPSRPHPPAAPGVTAGYRIYDTEAEAYISLPELAGRLSGVDVVLFGENHDDAVAHQVQRELLSELAAQPRTLVLGLESFGRDVQRHIDLYLAGRITETDFLAASRPWPNYSTAHRPLVELANEQQWSILASNVPRRIAAAIAQGGADSLAALPPDERRWAAGEVFCPRNAYYERFVAAMRGHGGGTAAHPGELDSGMIERFFEAQCLRDETMAEAIEQVLLEGPDVRVVHVQGGFHSDYRQGIVPRLERRVPRAEVRTISAIPVAEPMAAAPEEHRERADFLVFTRAARTHGSGGVPN
jgi:uncharacterized iron-regulated protein